MISVGPEGHDGKKPWWFEIDPDHCCKDPDQIMEWEYELDPDDHDGSKLRAAIETRLADQPCRPLCYCNRKDDEKDGTDDKDDKDDKADST